MPTAIENIYDAIVTKVDGALTGYYRIANPYDITTSNFLTRTKSYALAIGAAVATFEEFGCSVSWDRAFTITIAEKITTTENNVTLRSEVEKSLLAAHRSLMYAFYQDRQLGGLCTDCDIIDDSGVDLVGDEGKFLGIELTLLLKYRDDLTS